MADENTTPALPPVAGQENAQIGDENTAPVHDFEVAVNQDEAAVPASPPREPAKTVPVYEVFVKTDEVITDPNDPRAVQVPDAGRGDALLPIHAHVGARKVEDIFAEAGGESKVSDEDRAASAASGTTPKSARSSKKS
jgi:hypothetical protein